MFSLRPSGPLEPLEPLGKAHEIRHNCAVGYPGKP